MNESNQYRTLLYVTILLYIYNVFICRKFYVDLCQGKLKPYIDHPTRPEEKLFLLFDFTHNFKNVHQQG